MNRESFSFIAENFIDFLRNCDTFPIKIGMSMLRKFCAWQLSLTDEGKPLSGFRPLAEAIDHFFYETPITTKKAPHIRDAVDLKRWMMLVVFALVPCILMAIWNSGLQQFVWGSGDLRLMREFEGACTSLGDYFRFATHDGRAFTILRLGLRAFLPIVLISYIVGGTCEVIFACIRKTEVAEGFLVTGILYALILPPTIPYWMVAFGVATGVTLSKELFGGTGMNIMNPALCCRVILFFTFPGQMSGEIWVGQNPAEIRQSVLTMNREGNLGPADGYTQATALSKFNVGFDIKRVHVDAVASKFGKTHVHEATAPVIARHFEQWSSKNAPGILLRDLSPDQLRDFVTGKLQDGGLNLAPENYESAYRFSRLEYGQGIETDWNFFLGNKRGSFGETSTLACLIGAFILIITGVGSWRIMAAVFLGAYLTAQSFEFFSGLGGAGAGVWTPAMFGFPAYKHLLLGGLAFGAVFMATDPVSAPALRFSQWIYGVMIGFIAVLIREINPAYPEGVMLAILVGNVFSSLIDYYVAQNYRRFARARI
jgi:Na+-transporting NADH:ubiquinone oxidoreductase subunit B